jgi:threonyl-tRNA synthetase
VPTRIRDSESSNTPYIVLIGLKEEQEKMICVRKLHVGDVGPHKLDEWISEVKNENK